MTSQNMADAQLVFKYPKLLDELLLAAALARGGVSPFDCKVAYDKDGKVKLANKDTGEEIPVGQFLELLITVQTTNETLSAPIKTSYTVRAK